MATELAGLVVKVTQQGVKETAQALDGMASSAGNAEVATNALADTAKKSGNAVKGASAGYSLAAGAISHLRGSLGSLNALAEINAKGMRSSGLRADEYQSSLAKLKEMAQSSGASFAQLADVSMNAGDGILTLKSKTGEALAVLQRLSYSAREAGIGASEYDIRLKELSKTAWKNGTTLKELNSAHVEVTGSSYHLITAQGEVLNSMARSKEQIRATANEADFFNGKINMLYRTMGTAGSATSKYNMGLAQFDGYAKKARQTAEELARANTKVAMESQKATGGLGTFTSVLAGFASFSMAKTILGMADGMTNMRSQLELVTGSAGAAAVAQGELLEIANRTRSSFEGTATLYTRSSRALAAYGKTQQEVLAFTETINNAMRVGGVNATEQASALLQLSQALGSGRLQGQEFNAISEAAPILLDTVAKHLGVTTGALKSMAAEGKITTKVLFDAISGSSDEMKRLASTVQDTMGSAMTVLKNNSMALANEVLNNTGIMSGFSSVVSGMASNLHIAAPILGGLAVNAALATGAFSKLSMTMMTSPMGLAVSVFGLLATNTGYFKEALIGLTAIMAGRYAAVQYSSIALKLNEIKASTSATTAAIIEARAKNALADATTRAATASKKAIIAMGGLPGIAIGLATTLATAAIGYRAFSNETSSATAILDAQGKSVRELTEDYIKLGEVKLIVAKDGLLGKKGELDGEIAATSGKIRGLVSDIIDEQVKFVNATPIMAYLDDFSRGAITSTQLLQRLNASDVFTQAQIAQIITMADKMDGAKGELGEVERGLRGVDAAASSFYVSGGSLVVKALEQIADSASVATSRTKELISKLNHLKDSQMQSSKSLVFRAELIKGGASPRQAEYFDKLASATDYKKGAVSGAEYHAMTILAESDDRNQAYLSKATARPKTSGGGGVRKSRVVKTETQKAFDQYKQELESFKNQVAEVGLAMKQLDDFGFESKYTARMKLGDDVGRNIGKYAKMGVVELKTLSSTALEVDSAMAALDIKKFEIANAESIGDGQFQLSLVGQTSKAIAEMTRNRDLDLQVMKMSAGMSVEMKERLSEVTSEYRRQRDELEAQRELMGLDWAGGVKDGLIQFTETAGSLREQFATATAGTMSTLGDALGQFAATGKMNFREMSISIMADLAKIAIRMSMMNLVSSVAGAWAGGSTPTGAQSSTMPAGGFQFSKAQEMGGAWSGGVQMFAAGGAFTNSVVNSPTAFAHAGGLGVMGEAGPEAIMPLTRGSNGKLGVVAHGGGGGGGVGNVEINVIIQNDGSQKETSNGDREGRALGNLIEASVTKILIDEQHAGGLLYNLKHGR